jgi:putative Holliday junction resolvase
VSRLLAIDYGKKRSGVAVSDPLQLIAGGLDTIATGELSKFIMAYLEREDVERIIIGMPTQTDGTPSENARRVSEFISYLRKRISIPVICWDERFTSVLAHKTMLDSGLKKKARQNKALVDKISATIILQSYMDSERIAKEHKVNN